MPSPMLAEFISQTVTLGVLVLVFVPLERLFAAHPREVLRKGIWTDVGYYYLGSLIPVFLLSVPSGLLVWAAQHFVPDVVLQTTAAWPVGVRIAASVFVGDVGYYWAHRLSHEIPFLWDFHSIHHAPEEVDFLTNAHGHPFDIAFGRFCGMIPIFALGLAGNVHAPEYKVPAAATLFALLWGYFVHANVRWRFGPLEWLFATPAFHHWHHTHSGPINRNYAANFPVLDWAFGTAHLPDEFPSDYGIKGKVPDDLLGQLIHPLVSSTLMDGSPISAMRPDEPSPSPAADDPTSDAADLAASLTHH